MRVQGCRFDSLAPMQGCMPWRFFNNTLPGKQEATKSSQEPTMAMAVHFFNSFF